MPAAAPQDPAPPLARPVTSLNGVGPERAKQLAQLEIFTVEDLLLHRPRRYEDRRHFVPIAALRLEEAGTARGKIVALGVKWYRQRAKSIFEMILDDGTARLHCRWWNLPFMEKYFARGDEVVVFGKLLTLKPRTMDHPETETVTGEENFIHLNRITPIYSLTEGLPQRWLRGLMWRTLADFAPHIPEQARLDGPADSLSPPERGARPTGSSCVVPFEGWGEGNRACNPLTSSPRPSPPAGEEREKTATSSCKIIETRPASMARAAAIRLIHFPEAEGDSDRARRRLALDEFIALQRQILLRRKNFEARAQAWPCGGDNHLIKPFLARLGFKLTGAQTRVLRELRGDLSGAHPMRRLLQGDVGCGKTVVAACCALLALESGYSVALMAPTEILAEQHCQTFTKWFGPLAIPIAMRTGSRKTPAPDALTPALLPESRGSLTIGTHALLTESFALPNLGLVIIDEQHKFGVAQREQFLRKGRYPHLLVMTATPIPRTLGLTIYGELDVSIIDESPPGRGTVKTFVRAEDKLPKVWAFMRDKLAEGRQACVVYPRVEEAGPNGIKAVTREFARLQGTLAPFKAGLLHGRLKSGEKEAVMAAFRANTIQVLLATSLIEVGVDVPNATIMVIENAGQFGLAQLHQLRGRIGRGAHDSYCILVAGAQTPEAAERLKVMEETTDGFRIAEADLKLRGPGELLGQQQSGAPEFRFGDLAADLDLITEARQIAANQLG